MFDTKYMKKQPKKIKKFKKGGIVPRVGGKASDNYFDPREDEHRLQDVDVTMYQKAGERDRSSDEKRFYDDGTRIPGWQGGKNDAWREKMGFKRLKDE